MTVKALIQQFVLQIKIKDSTQEYQLGGNSAYNRLCKELKQTENAINNLLNAIEQGGSNNSAMQRVRDLEKKQDELQCNILIEKAKITVKLTEDEIRQFYKKALNLEGQVLINYFVKEILLYDDKANIIFNSPISTSPDDNQALLFVIKQSKCHLWYKISQCLY